MIESIEYIAEALKQARLKKNLSQRALSAKTRIPQNHISHIENSKVDLQLSSLIALARALELEFMLVPRSLIPAFEALLSGKPRIRQVPKYQLDQEAEESDE